MPKIRALTLKLIKDVRSSLKGHLNRNRRYYLMYSVHSLYTVYKTESLKF